MRDGRPLPGVRTWDKTKIDRPRLYKSSKSFVGIKLNRHRPKVQAQANVALTISPVGSSVTARSAPPAPELPLHLQGPAALLQLSSDGEKVIWPPGLSNLYAKQLLDGNGPTGYSPSSSSTSPPQPPPPPPPASERSSGVGEAASKIDLSVLADMIDLLDQGEKVMLPFGLSRAEALVLLSQP